MYFALGGDGQGPCPIQVVLAHLYILIQHRTTNCLRAHVEEYLAQIGVVYDARVDGHHDRPSDELDRLVAKVLISIELLHIGALDARLQLQNGRSYGLIEVELGP